MFGVLHIAYIHFSMGSSYVVYFIYRKVVFVCLFLIQIGEIALIFQNL